MTSPESHHNAEEPYSDEELRHLLSDQTQPGQHIEGLLALGLTPGDLFGVLDVTEDDMQLVSEEDLEAAQEAFNGEDAHGVLRLFGATEEDLIDVSAYLEQLAQTHNESTVSRFADRIFLSRRGQRIVDDVRKAAAILMEDEANRSFIAAWLLTPNLSCEGERPLDQLKVDPVQVLAAAHGQSFSDTGRISDLYGHL